MRNATRRQFLSDAFRMGTLASIMPLSVTACSNQSPAALREPLFRFLQVNDIHVQGDHLSRTKVVPTYAEANIRAAWLRGVLQNNSFLPALDFVVLNGDMVHGESLEAIKFDLDYFHKTFLRDLPVPVYPVMGNHENLQLEGVDEYQAAYTNLFGSNKLNYSFVHKGLEFIMINNAGTWVINDKCILDHRINTFRSLLGANPGLPKIVCCHIPLVAVRDKDVLSRSFGFNSFCTRELEMAELVEKTPNVLAVTSGHLHLSGVVKKGNTHHISVSGLASYPHDMALFSVFADRVEVELVRVPSNLLVPSTNIHGAHRHGRDYTDATHSEYTTYVMGIDGERKFSIPMQKKTVAKAG
jgi:hypothetical protein